MTDVTTALKAEALRLRTALDLPSLRPKYRKQRMMAIKDANDFLAMVRAAVHCGCTLRERDAKIIDQILQDIDRGRRLQGLVERGNVVHGAFPKVAAKAS